MADIKDILVSSFFSIEFQGQVVGAFRECTGLGSKNELVEYKASGQKGDYLYQLVPGRLTFNHIKLKRGITDSMDMWKWRKLVEQGKIKDARKNGTLTMHNQQGDAIAKWNFTNAWPLAIEGPGPTAGSNEVAIEELELVYEGYERVS
jgi:phage tail-like protein